MVVVLSRMRFGLVLLVSMTGTGLISTALRMEAGEPIRFLDKPEQPATKANLPKPEPKDGASERTFEFMRRGSPDDQVLPTDTPNATPAARKRKLQELR